MSYSITSPSQFVKDYVNSSNTELSCPAAYRTEKMVLQNMYIMILEFKRQGQLQYGILRGTFLNDRCLITNRHFFSVTEEEYLLLVYEQQNWLHFQIHQLACKQVDTLSV